MRDRLLAHPLTYYFRLAFGAGAFYFVWFGVLWAAVQGRPYFGPLLVVGTIVVHCILSPQWKKDLCIILIICLSGTLLDSLYLNSGMLTYATPNPYLTRLCPLWLVSLYALFGMTLDHSLSWLQKSLRLAVVLGAGGGVLSYIAGAKLGAVVFNWDVVNTLAFLAVIWAFLCPTWLYMSRRMHRYFT